MRRRNGDNNDTFWISYADLMAGLLFIFVLLVGAIIIKFLFLQQDIKSISQELIDKQHELHISLDSLKEKEKKLSMTSSRLTKLEQEAIQSAFLINKLRKKELSLEEREKELRRLNSDLNTSLLSTMASLDMTRSELQIQENHLDLTRQELETLSKQLLLTQEESVRIATLLKTSEAELLKRDETIETQSQTLFLKNSELSKMATLLLEKSRQHQSIVEQLDLTKMQIKHLTGIRIKVISALKESVGGKVKIDAKNGSIRFNSGVFFEQNGATLTPQAKKDLKIVLNEYIDTLMSHRDIAPYLDRIDIVGYTNTDGSYLHNLTLSQKRAYVVLEYLISQDFRYAEDLKNRLSATGRGYNDLILKDGLEDKDASRRIEIKFRLKDEDAIRQIEKILG
ncbi:MAG: OmpA family protein [Campylobacterota bacterium]|nr:OmpA family protein [Campylobacterota bacterium]